MRTPRWTKKEELLLLQGIGSNGLAWICRKVGNRSKHAVYAKLRYMSGNGGLTRGSYTLAGLCRLTGYNVSQLKRAMNALKQKWKKTSSKGSYVITEDQFEEIAAWLGLDYWSKPHKLYKCLWCHTRDNLHKAYGLCEECLKIYSKRLRQLGIIRSMDGVRVYVRTNFKGKRLENAEKLLSRNRALDKNMLW